MIVMNNTPLISVIVPVYNVEQYLRKCIESIINQTYEYLQIILVDDGSTDDSGKICDEYKAIDERIIVIHQKNKGLVGARNTGLEVANGEYIGFVDSDDYVDREMYDSLLKYAMLENADMVHSGYYVYKWGTERECINFNRCIIEKQSMHENFLDEILSLKTNVAPSIWSKLFKRELIKRCYEDVEDMSSYGEDLICLISVIIQPCRIALYDKAFYHYREREESISHIKKSNSLEKELALCENIKKVLIKNEVYSKFQNSFTRFLKLHVCISLEKDSDNEFIIQKYAFPEPEVLQNKKIVIFGAGRVGKDYYSQMSRYNRCDVVAWVDSYPKKNKYEYIDVMSIDSIHKIEFDILIVALLNKKDACDVIEELKQHGVDTKKIIWKKPHMNI